VIDLFYGFDPREEVGCHTFVSSVIHHASEPVRFTPLRGDQRDGSNAFTYARFLIPHLMEYRGWALFCDGADMIVKDDIAGLWAMRNEFLAVQVVQHDYRTKHRRKYVGTQMEADNRDYPRKNWSSVMLINCAHYDWRRITPETIAKMSGEDLHGLTFIRDRYIGSLPPEWNWLADEHGEWERASLLHWTAGIPAWPMYGKSPHAKDWWEARDKVTHATC